MKTTLRRLRKFAFGRPIWKKLVLMFALILIGFSAFTYVWIFRDLPSIGDLDAGLALPATRIYDRNGRLLYEILPPEQGANTIVPLAEIPQHCVNAAIATEDANYYSHPGVDPEGIARAVWINVRGGEVLAGGSTITQQTARLLLMDPQQRLERSLQRKLKEMVLAVQLQREYSKDEVLALYLNQSYFGNLAYGIEAAARGYFGKGASELALSECALLIGLMQNPAYYDPFSNQERAKARQEVVLNLMADEGYISAVDAEAAKRDELQYNATRFPIDAPHFVMTVWAQLERDYPEYVYGGGIDVTTTVDVDWTRAAEEIVGIQLEYLNNPPLESRIPANARNAAILAMDPYTGEILTMLGSPDYFEESIAGAVNATLALRQPGSTLKPFTYAAAMNPSRDDPWTAAQMILDVETPFVTRKLESYTPANYGLVEHGPVLVREALASSYNIPAVVALEAVGIQDFVNLVDNAGLETLSRNTNVDLSITLGGGEVRLLDLVQAYSIFPNGGYRIEPTFIRKVETHDGEVLYEWEGPELSNRVLDERIAYIITDILSDEDARIPSFGRNSALSIGRPAAAKTGTTTDFRDNWVIGYTPDLVVGVWVGNADNSPMVDVTGVSGAGPIWNAFMREVLLGRPELEFQRPEGILETEVCALSGLLPTPECRLRRMELFLPGTVPNEEDNLYQTFVIDRETGLLATPDTPADQLAEQVYIVLPQEARDWGLRNGIRQPPLDAAVQIPDADVGLRLLNPDPYAIFQISPITPVETQRVRFEVGASPQTTSVTYLLNGEALATVDTAPFSIWWQLELGEFELQAVATLEDGSEEHSEALLFSVNEYVPPYSRTVVDAP